MVVVFGEVDELRIMKTRHSRVVLTALVGFSFLLLFRSALQNVTLGAASAGAAAAPEPMEGVSHAAPSQVTGIPPDALDKMIATAQEYVLVLLPADRAVSCMKALF